MSQHELIVTTNGRGAVDISAQINEIINATKAKLCHVFVAHTSASLMITGNEDANLLLDIEDYFLSGFYFWVLSPSFAASTESA